MATAAEQAGVDLYNRFLKALNDGDYDGIAQVMAPDFEDHHPGFEVHGVAQYQEALRGVAQTLQIRAELEEILTTGDRIIARVALTGRHVGPVLGFAPTGKAVSWTTTEIWRVADGMLVERWAEDDLLGLRNQLSPDAENVELIRRLNDVVNERRYDDMDELFDESFVDRNPAWSVTGVAELKELLKVAKAALEFTSQQDLIYPAEGGKIVIHLTFTGRHVGEFFGVQPTGKEVQWTSIEVFRIENRKIVERWVQADTTGLMKQLGVTLP
ncbi:ester cyclase [Kitasatospora sp. NPDC001175]|uniref:ester cyclase n=1 Tax=Kitasatospora sp. NPDC001175 TaxID=3157103 RepID=UPI003CFC2C02